MTRLARTLSDWVQAEPRLLQEIESQVESTRMIGPAGISKARRITS